MPAYYQRLTIDENDEHVLVVVLPLCHDWDKDLIDEADMTLEERSIDDLTTRPTPQVLGREVRIGNWLSLLFVWFFLSIVC